MLKPKLGVGVVVYGDVIGLDRLINSVYEHVNRIIVVHAKFEGFQETFEDSAHETRKTIRKYRIRKKAKIDLIKCDDGQLSQITARNLYMQHAATDWLLVLDTDEYVTPNTKWDAVYEDLEHIQGLELRKQVYDVQFEGPIAEFGCRPRFFYKPATIEYWNRHYWWLLEDGATHEGQRQLLKGQSDSGRTIKGIYVIHDKTVRFKEHFNAMINYANWQNWNEGRSHKPKYLIKP